jgi:hypothetical protein
MSARSPEKPRRDLFEQIARERLPLIAIIYEEMGVEQHRRLSILAFLEWSPPV